jgi:pSer/pThr/pTyr-binding forkhead associated (FHA) protein
VWLTEDAVLVRDLGSRNGTFVDGRAVTEAQVFSGQTLRLGDIEMVLAEAPARISVPELPRYEPRAAARLADGTLCCLRHDTVAATLQCGRCRNPFCGSCVRELRVAGHPPRHFCPECGGPCEPLSGGTQKEKRSWLGKIVDAFTRPPARKR